MQFNIKIYRIPGLVKFHDIKHIYKKQTNITLNYFLTIMYIIALQFQVVFKTYRLRNSVCGHTRKYDLHNYTFGWLYPGDTNKRILQRNAQYAEKQDYYILHTLLLYRLVLNQNNISTFQQSIFKTAEVTHLQSHCTYILLNVSHSELPVNFKPYEDRPRSKTKCHSPQIKKL